MSKLKIRDALYVEVDRLFEQVKRQEESYNKKVAAREMLRKRGDIRKKEQTLFELRVVTLGASFYIYWYRVKFIKFKNKLIRRTIMIKAKNGVEYLSEQFAGASEWEMQIITDCEKIFTPARISMKHLLKAHRSIYYACKYADDEKMESIPLIERCDIKIKSIREFKEKFNR